MLLFLTYPANRKSKAKSTDDIFGDATIGSIGQHGAEIDLYAAATL
jgi:hypothetical protein